MKTIKEYLSTPEGVEQKWNIINEILENFDFVSIHILMDALDWMWYCTEKDADEKRELGNKVKVHDDFSEFLPKPDDLRKRARELLGQVITECGEKGLNEYTIATGGFEVYVAILTDEERVETHGEDTPDDFEHSVDLRLKFVAEDSGSRFW